MEPLVVTSPDNRWVRLVRKLATAQGRDKQQAFVVEGLRAVREVALSGATLAILVDTAVWHDADIAELVQLARPAPVISVATEVLLPLCDTKTPQGVLAVARNVDVSLDAALSATPPLVVVSAGLQDPGNMGTLIRLADAVGAGAFVATRGSCDLYNPKVVRSTMGSLLHLPLCRDVDDSLLVSRLSLAGYSIVAADTQGEATYWEREYKRPLAVVFGNEGSGLAELWRERAELVRIPMPGRAESLNVSVAAGVLLYEILRQWRATLPSPPCS
ncbi:MAG: RNA methyltransferase [Selenomonadales bacterium]|nr:RNA methyltransferase [Selenomonadales bacterium]